ncbi:Rv3235 family protein [Actinopolyspora halophila]|uniref:Rv3235 family protein n=1 Tax=Actinopolyspora halophila TaxID=1850 RepID=UPI001B7FBD60|nr:Rv3235 family protein [Actinopolyspora halophila]
MHVPAAQRTRQNPLQTTPRTSASGKTAASPRHESRTPPTYSASALADRAGNHLVEVLAGRRPLHQIRQWLSRPVASLLATLVRSGSLLHDRTRLSSVHACLTSSTTVEACLVVDEVERHRALTIRLEQQRMSWCCTLLALV